MGRVIEDLVEAYALLTAKGRITASRPSSDVDHKDFVFDERGGYRNIYLQVKGVTQVNVIGQVRMHVEFRTKKLLSNPRFLYLFCLLDVKSMRIGRMWLVPSPEFNRLAPRLRTRTGGVQFAFVAGKKSKWDRFTVEAEELGAKLLNAIEETKQASPLKSPHLASLIVTEAGNGRRKAASN
jgi:hypothetical protein